MSILPLPIDWLPSPLWCWYGSSFLQITFIGGLTEVDGVMGKIGDELLLLWFKALSPLLTAFDVLLVLLWLFADELLLLLLDESVGVCLMCDDFVPPLVVLVVEFVVLLFDDDEVVLELLEFRVVDELPEDFELLRLVDDDEDVWCWSCWRHFARRFLNHTWKGINFHWLVIKSHSIYAAQNSIIFDSNIRRKSLNWIFRFVELFPILLDEFEMEKAEFSSNEINISFGLVGMKWHKH
jgi:hypothetical protein